LKTPTVPNAEKPRTAGLCGRSGAEKPPGLYLVLLSNRQVLSGFPHRRLKAGANSADACPGCRDATLAPKAAHSGSQVATTLEREEPPTAGWLHLQGVVS